MFGSDPRDSVGEDDLYRLINARADEPVGIIKQHGRRAVLHWHPDRAMHRQRVMQANAGVSEELDRDTERLINQRSYWVQNAKAILDCDELRLFWSYHIRRCLGRAAYFRREMNINIESARRTLDQGLEDLRRAANRADVPLPKPRPVRPVAAKPVAKADVRAKA